MTAFIARIQNDLLRQFIWTFWWPWVNLDLWLKFRKSPTYRETIKAAFWLGMYGIK